MKNKLLKFTLILVVPLVVSSCDFSSSSSSSSSEEIISTTTTTSDEPTTTTTTTTSETPSVGEDECYVYTNESSLSDSKGGFTSTSYQNSEVVEIEYDYEDYFKYNYYSSMTKAPSTGDLNILVVPVKLANSSLNYNEETRYDIYNAYFGTSESTGFESVASYFYKSSYGNLRISGVVTPWYETTYTASIGSVSQVMRLASTALSWYKETFNSNASEFDNDSDGYVDVICLIYNVPYDYAGNDNLWAYTSWASNSANIASPSVSTFFWASVDFMYETSHIEIDAHTYIHEMGHALGLDDYYNYDDTSREDVAGGFIMQSYNVGDHDPYSKMALGWTSPLLVTGETTVTISSFTETGEFLVLKPDNQMNSVFDEYIIVDLYTPTNLNEMDANTRWATYYPKGPTTTGVRIWHVDARLVDIVNAYNYTITTTISSNSSVYHATSNSTDEIYGSIVPTMRNYRLLHLLEADGNFDFKNGSYFSDSDMWYEGDSFTLSDYSSSFANSTVFNNGETFPYKITVDSINDNQATISITLI